MRTPCEKFQELLKKLFQFDCAELDFGIYRIMNHKRAVIERFIDKELPEIVAKEITSGALKRESGLAQELAEVTKQIKDNFGEDAVDAEGSLDARYHGTPLGKRYRPLFQRAGGAKPRPEQEAEVYNHLYAFFSRYYDAGDFMSLRRYSKRDKYAVPYNGEEVHLHWANSDQYYIKTGENFTDYSYAHSGWSVRFKLRTAEVEQNNAKGAKRFFVPRAVDVVLDAAARTLTVPFDYRPLVRDEELRYGNNRNGANGNSANGNESGGNGAFNGGNGGAKKGQEAILADAAPAIAQAAESNPDALAALMQEKRKDADGRPIGLLEHHLRAYTRKNTSDFFIHKDLKGFLERELDFYLKNEVLNLDDLEAGGGAARTAGFRSSVP